MWTSHSLGTRRHRCAKCIGGASRPEAGPSSTPSSHAGHPQASEPLSSELGTNGTVKARFRPWLRPDSGRGFQVKVLKPFKGVPSSLGSGAPHSDNPLDRPWLPTGVPRS